MPNQTQAGPLDRRTLGAGEDRRSAARLSSDSLRPGTQLNGIYEIDSLLASGGMGEVYIGHAIQTGHRVAIKVIRSEFADNELVRSLFRNEASSLHQLHHEAIVRYFIFAVDPVLQRAYLAMDFVEGESLSRMLQRGPMPAETVARLAVRVAQGLHAAHTHRQGITHRDVSPDNIIIRDGDVGAAMIIDFGIARSTRAGNETIVDSGFAGKYNYVSPEQLGLFGGAVTPKTDIYSLGLVLLAALQGSPLDMCGSPAEVISKRQTVPSLDTVDARVRPILARMLQPDPANRPASMLEVVRFFENLQTGQRRAPPAPARLRAETRPKPPPARMVLILGAAVAVIGIATGAYLLLMPPVVETPVVPEVRLEPPQAETKTEAAQEAHLGPEITDPTRVRAERITRFVETYKGGPCFGIDAVDPTRSPPSIDGLGMSPAPFEELDRAFKSAFGIEAQIRAMLIRPAQCPALAFAQNAKAGGQPAPRIEVAASVLAAGRSLTGTVSEAGTRRVELLLVSEDGAVRNVSRYLGRGEPRTFDIPMQKPDVAGEPRLLVAVASAKPLTALADGKPTASDAFFEKVMAEVGADKARLGVTLRYFQVE